MPNHRPTRPLILVAAGLVGMSLFLVGDHYHLTVIPTQDFAKGFWFGICIGVELVGVLLILKAKRRAKSAS